PKDQTIMYIGTDNGIYILENDGSKWSDKINKGLCICDITYMDQYPNLDTIALIETNFHGTQQYLNSSVFYHSSDEGGGQYL
ncbi:MAG TPA: hypothetical protein VFR94_07470, partial [Nitrososphaeraceae archaeon]|nr:hypothetical protein [Nitrososphaeraceae archaeon]